MKKTEVHNLSQSLLLLFDNLYCFSNLTRQMCCLIHRSRLHYYLMVPLREQKYHYISVSIFLVSTHIVSLTHSVVQELGWVGKICCQNYTEYHILGKEYPLPLRNGYSHGWILGKGLPRTPPYLELELLVEDLGTSVLSLSKINPPPPRIGALCMGLVCGDYSLYSL